MLKLLAQCLHSTSLLGECWLRRPQIMLHRSAQIDEVSATQMRKVLQWSKKKAQKWSKIFRKRNGWNAQVWSKAKQYGGGVYINDNRWKLSGKVHVFQCHCLKLLAFRRVIGVVLHFKIWQRAPVNQRSFSIYPICILIWSSWSPEWSANEQGKHTELFAKKIINLVVALRQNQQET